MTDPLTAVTLLLVCAMVCVTVLLFNRQLNQNSREIARLKLRQRSVEAAFDGEEVELPQRLPDDKATTEPEKQFE